MSASLLIANTGKKGERRFVLRQVSKPRRKAAKRAARRARPGHRAATNKARKNPGEYHAAFNRLKSDMVAATKAAKAAAVKAKTAALRTHKKASAARAAWRANPSKKASGKSVAQRLAALRARLGPTPGADWKKRSVRKNPVQAHVVGALSRKNPEKKMATKKRRTAKQKAATRKMIAANRRSRGKKHSGKKTRKVGHKKHKRARRASAPKKLHRRKRARRAASPLRSTVRRLSRGKRRLHKGARKAAYKKLNKGQRTAVRHRSLVRHARVAGIRARLGGVSTKTLREYGLTRVNPSPMGVLKDIGGILPKMAVAGLAFVGVAAGAVKLISYLPDTVKAWWKPAPGGTDYSGYVPVIGGVLFALGGYGLARMYPQTAEFAAPVAFGGAAGAVLHALRAITVKDASNADISLGKSLGIPIGEYVSVAGYVDVGGGRMMSVNGIGEYVSVAGLGSRNVMRLPGGQSMRYEGALAGLNEYVMDPVGLSGFAGGIFPTSTLADDTQSQVPLNRAPMWGLKGDPDGNVNIRKLLGAGDDSGVAGGIFDRSR